MYIDNVYDLPEDDGVRQIIEPQGIKSLITIPIMDQNHCIGFIGFDSVRNFHKYSERERTLLFVFAEIYLNITKRIALEQKLIEEKENAKAASKAKSEFLANMSHEIRTPLNGVIGFTDLLLKTPLDPTQQQYAENANTSGKALLSIINDILDFSKIEAGKLELEIIKSDLVDLLEQATDILKFHASQKNIELLLNIPLDMPRFARVDPIRLKQILINLLSNAVKFTEIGEVELRVTFEKLTDKKGRYKFSVRDTGIGISEDQQKKLFKAFTQADSTTTRKFGGTGLGLTISNLLATKMGGEIKLESTFNKGSIFYFTIETDYEFGEKYLEQDELEIESVLVIDDNENNRTILEHNFRRWNVKFHGVEGGPQALELLQKANDFDLLIIDYHMPEMDGLETIRRIRDIFHTHPHRTPIILLHSSSDDQSLRGECKKLGVKFNLVKPVKAGELYQFLKNIHIEETVKAKKNPTPSMLAEIKGPINILVAEDVKMNMLLTRTLLKRIVPNANVIEAYNGLEVVHATRAHAVDLVLMDVQMPELDGLEATYQIRELDKLNNRHLPVIALTAGAFKEERERCISSGMDDFLTKPIQIDELTRILGKYLLNNKTLR
jgi:signal transduction histidine kinase/CheY-like chemotaxis protein